MRGEGAAAARVSRRNREGRCRRWGYARAHPQALEGTGATHSRQSAAAGCPPEHPGSGPYRPASDKSERAGERGRRELSAQAHEQAGAAHSTTRPPIHGSQPSSTHQELREGLVGGGKHGAGELGVAQELGNRGVSGCARTGGGWVGGQGEPVAGRWEAAAGAEAGWGCVARRRWEGAQGGGAARTRPAVCRAGLPRVPFAPSPSMAALRVVKGRPLAIRASTVEGWG